MWKQNKGKEGEGPKLIVCWRTKSTSQRKQEGCEDAQSPFLLLPYLIGRGNSPGLFHETNSFHISSPLTELERQQGRTQKPQVSITANLSITTRPAPLTNSVFKFYWGIMRPFRAGPGPLRNATSPPGKDRVAARNLGIAAKAEFLWHNKWSFKCDQMEQ